MSASERDALLVADDVELTYGCGVPVVTGASLRVHSGDSIGIAGESGSGKSTLARALVGELAPSRGVVTVAGRSWSAVRRTDPERRIVQMVYQDPYGALNPAMTPRQAVAEALGVVRGIPRARRSAAAGELLRDVGLAERHWDVHPARLSGGQRQRAVIARALACEPRVLVADEPTSALDMSVQAQILNLLMDLRAERDLALVVISHDLAVLRHLTERCLVMLRGQIIEDDATESVFESPQHPYTRALVTARTARPGGEDVPHG